MGERRRKEERGRQRRGQQSLGGESDAKGARLWRSRGSGGRSERVSETRRRSSPGRGVVPEGWSRHDGGWPLACDPTAEVFLDDVARCQPKEDGADFVL